MFVTINCGGGGWGGPYLFCTGEDLIVPENDFINIEKYLVIIVIMIIIRYQEWNGYLLLVSSKFLLGLLQSRVLLT